MKGHYRLEGGYYIICNYAIMPEIINTRAFVRACVCARDIACVYVWVRTWVRACRLECVRMYMRSSVRWYVRSPTSYMRTLVSVRIRVRLCVECANPRAPMRECVTSCAVSVDSYSCVCVGDCECVSLMRVCVCI